MRYIGCLYVLFFLATQAQAQYVYTIKADSVKITNCDSAELILENHTQNVPGFLFNTGNGRTVFKRVLQKINDSVFLVGPDTLDIPVKLVAANGLNISNDTVQLGGNMLNTAAITTSNNRIWFKTPFRAAEDTGRTGQIFFGDSDYIQLWTNPPPYNQDGQYNAAVVISKTKENNNENVDLLALTTSDAPGKNGWRFYDYTNTSGLVCPRLETYSNAGSTDYAFEHDILGKSTSNPMYMLNFQDYDSSNVASKYSPTTADYFAIANNYSMGFYVDNNFDVGIGKKPTFGVRLDVAGSANISNVLSLGQLGVGTPTPTALLQIAAGTSSAGTAPLKLTAGSLLTTPENGAVEYDGTSYYVTESSTRYKLVKALTGQLTTNFSVDSLNAFSSVTANLTVTGCQPGSVVSVSANSGAINSPAIIITAFVTSANTVTIRAYNAGNQSLALASDTYNIEVLQ
jgi:hypothetical protein